MAKHIHIHLPSKTRDAGWDESKHHRNHGQFASSSGGASRPAPMAGPSGKLPERRGSNGMTVSSMQNVQARIDAKKAAAAAAKKTNPLYDKPKAAGKEPSDDEMKKHPNYNKDDHEYLKGKGWKNSEIHQRWTAEHQAGRGAQKVNKHNPPSAF